MIEISDEARRIHASSIVIDTHVDTVVRWIDLDEDLGVETGNGYMDLPLMKRGNLTASFFACCVGFHHIAEGTAIQRALGMIDGVKEICRFYPDDVEVALGASDVRRIAAADKLAAIIAIEGGHAIGDDLRVLRQYFDLGVAHETTEYCTTSPETPNRLLSLSYASTIVYATMQGQDASQKNDTMSFRCR